MLLHFTVEETTILQHSETGCNKEVGDDQGVAFTFKSYQLFTCNKVRLVCAAICLFSSSVG